MVSPRLARLRARIRTRRGFVKGRTKFILALRRAQRTGGVTTAEFKQLQSEFQTVAEAQRARQLGKLQEAISKGEAKPITETVTVTTPDVEAARAEARRGLMVQQPSISDQLVLTTPTTARQFVEQIPIRQALPTFSTLQRITKRPVLITRQVRRQVAPVKVVAPEPTISPGQARRVEQLVQREERLRQFGQRTAEALGIEDRPDKPFAVRAGTATLRKVFIEIPSAPVFLGGRAAFATESLFTRAGRQELRRAAKATPKAIVKAFDPRTPGGLVNIGFALFSVGKVGRTIRAARQQPQFTVKGLSTKRITTRQQIVDISRGRIEALVGKRKIAATVTGKQTFVKQPTEQFLIKGTGKVRILGKPSKIVKLETRGIATPKDQGFDVVQITRATKGLKVDRFLTTTKTQPLITQPRPVFRTITDIRTLGKRTPLEQAKPSAVATGITAEAFRKNVLTETGKVLSTEQILRTGQISVSAGTFAKAFQFKITRPTIPGRITAIPSKVPLIAKTTVKAAGPGAQQLLLETKQITTVPVQAQPFVGTGIAQLKSVARGVQTREFLVSGARELARFTPVKAVTAVSPIAKVRPVTRLEARLLPAEKPRTKALPLTRQTSFTRIFQFEPVGPITLPKVSPIDIVTPKPAQVPTIAQVPQQIPVAPVLPPPVTVVPPDIPTPVAAPLPKVPKLEFPKEIMGEFDPFAQEKEFVPSATAIIGDIRGRVDRERLFTGGELRPIPL